MHFLLMGPSGGQGQPDVLSFLTPFIIVFAIMWLLVIRPQRKERKKRELMLSNLTKGDQVITQGGIVGKVTRIKEEKVELKVDESNNTKLMFLRTAVINVIDNDQKKQEKKN